ncbi:MAG: hypothetical protein KAX78_12150, partial [Phycisphaerae bacterium]|nr:hypothetical protein [Phycisphaerae bacterium]
MCATVCSPGVELYVSPDGSDSNTGTRSEPFATIDRARQAARRIKNKPITVYLRGGTYYLAKTIVLGPQDSGARGAPVVYAAYKDERPVISGGTRLEVKWTRHERSIMKAEVPGAKRGKIDFDQLFIDGRRRHMARYPNHDPKRLPFGGASAEATSRRRAKRWADPASGFVHAIHGSRWGSVHFRITGVDDSGKLKLTGGWQNNRPTGMHRDRFVENI